MTEQANRGRRCTLCADTQVIDDAGRRITCPACRPGPGLVRLSAEEYEMVQLIRRLPPERREAIKAMIA